MKKQTHSGHRKRLRERFLHESVYDHELLELALFYVRPLVNTNSIAHELIEKFKNISGVLNADIDELQTVEGIGLESALYLKILLEGVRRYLDTSQKNVIFTSYAVIEDYFRSYFGNTSSEICVLMTVGASLELLGTVTLTNEQISTGRITRRELVGMLLKNKTYRLIVGVNHAESCTFPKQYDFMTAKMFAEVSEMLGIDFLDFVVCGGGNAYSMHKHGAFSF